MVKFYHEVRPRLPRAYGAGEIGVGTDRALALDHSYLSKLPARRGEFLIEVEF